MTRSIVFLSLVLGAGAAVLADWRQFRGNAGNATAPDVQLPLTWGQSEGESHIAWRRDLPGRGPSSPIVVAGRVIVTCSSGIHQDRLHVVCYDSVKGDLLWERQFWAAGRTLTNPTSANAAPTPVTDGKAIYAFFSSNDLVCLDLDGNLRWYRGLGFDYPQAGNDVGMSSSPVVIAGTVIVQVESQGDSFAAGIATQTGETRWRIERPREASWSSPITLSKDVVGRDVALLQGPSGLTAVDARRGDVLWSHPAACSGISSPVAVGNRVYFPGNGVTALDLGTNAAEMQIAWESSRLRPGAGSVVVSKDRIYLVNNSGVLVCGDASNGELLWQLRLSGRCWATPIVAGDRLYVVNSDGKAFVVQVGDKGEIVGESDLGEVIQGTPAVDRDVLFIRSDRHLWKITAGETP